MASLQDNDGPAKSRPEPAVTELLEPSGAAVELVRVLDDYLADLQAGKPADRTALLAAHPHMAGQLEQCLAGIEFIHRAGRTTGDLPAQLGDFRIGREIGRGGMGVVFEAEQLSLHRTVALKILRFGVSDKEALDRFRYEAETVAKLHHTNIVPIFAIGCENGVNFYAMQYIQGRSLAEVIERKSQLSVVSCQLTQADAASPLAPTDNGPLTTDKRPPKGGTPTLSDIAGWGLQAAEALAHAHGRGVIHRDIKPSNLLLDDEGTLWLTDFGLAKRMDEVTMTLTGAILGTPRYMSPEQAAASRQPVDHRTDIYSLGATLYELVTGQPVFAASTPHEVISQIITTEPRPPRQFDRSLPRDLETIVLKCLAKEPARRYQSAQELADDLRAFIDGRPIAARRLGPVARGTRWVKKHRRIAAVMAAVAAGVAALFVGGFLAWRSHEESLLGQLSLSTSGPSLVAEVLDQNDRPVEPSIPVPTSRPLELREGSYRLRLSSPGMLSQNYPLGIDAGGTAAPDVQLEDRWIWPPMELKPGEFVEPVAFGKRTDLLVFRQSDSSLRRIDGATGKPAWPSDLRLDKDNLPADEDINEWQSLLRAGWFNPWSSSWLADSLVDLDGDGEPDLIIGSRAKPAIIAISGKSGKLLWWCRGRSLPGDTKDLAGLKLASSGGADTPVIGRPVIAHSANNEAPRVIGCFSSSEETYRRADNSMIKAPEQTWLEAVSGKTGASVWRYPLKETLKLPSSNNPVAAALEAIGQPQLARVGGKSIVVCSINTMLYGVDLETGKEAWPPFDLGFSPDAAPRIVEQPSGDPLALFLSGQQRNGNYNAPQKLTLTVISLGDRKKLWSDTLDSVSRREFQISGSESNAPHDVEIEPLGRDGAPAIVAAATHIGKEYERFHSMSGSTKGRIDMAVLDPATGHKRWEKPLCWFGYNQPNRRWLVGDDLDGDGYRELFAAWVAEGKNGRSELTVAAIAGGDGQTLWRWSIDGVPADENNPQRPLSWWQPTEDGHPLLVVPVNRGPGGQPATYILESASGKLRHTLAGVADPRTCDLNGDGLADLLYKVEPQGFARLMAIRGEPPTAYRWLDGRQRRVAQDFDGDGLDDLLIDDWGGPVYPEKAISGRDGSLLWKIVHHSGNEGRAISAPLPLGDLAGDGRPAIVCFAPHEPDAASQMYVSGLEVAAYSGRDGRRLWAKNRGSEQVSVSNGSSSGNYNGRSFSYPSLAFARLDPNRPSDILVAVPAMLDPNAAAHGGNNTDVSLNVVAGDTGKLRWRAPVVQGQFGDNGRIYRDEFRDLNGDGVADIVAWVLPPNAKYGATNLELAAFSGADGSRLWTGSPPILGPQDNNGYMQVPVVGDLEGKGMPDVLFVRNPQGWDKHELVVVGGRDGRVKWSWSWVGQSNGNAQPQLVDFAGSGRRSVCMFISEQTKVSENATTWLQKVVVLDNTGKVQKRIDAKGNGNLGGQFYGNQSWWHSIDLGAGSKQALLFYDDGALQALGGESIEPLWKWPLPADDANLLEVLPAGNTFPATIAIWSGKSIYGLSCVTGRPRWRGEMPGTIPNWNSFQAERVVMRDSNGLGLPRLLFGDACRLTWPTDDDGRYLPPRGVPTSYAPLSDPVDLRPLPWTEMPEAIPIILKMIPWSILWLIVPVMLMRRAFQRNSWRLAFVPAFYQLGMTLALNVIPLRMLPFNRNDWVDWDPHVGLCFLTGAFLIVHALWMLRRRLWALVDASAIYAIAIAIGWSQRLDGSNTEQMSFPFYRQWYESLGSMLAVVFGGLPILFGIAFIVAWLRRRQWLRLGLFVVATIIGAAICAYTAIDKDRYWKGPEEQYSLDGWWLILLYGAYFAAVLAMTGWLVKWAFASLRPKLSRLLKRIRRKADA